MKSSIWSVTSFNELTREAQAIDRENRFSLASPKVPYITQCLADTKGPVIATTDYMRNYAEQVRKYIPGRYEVLVPMVLVVQIHALHSEISLKWMQIM
ncbi:Pyruvate dehydrogenase E1 component (EC [uncultured Gammaproteobacteria bacterium]|nr:Pyruvate dehydrogenase E1 component (EC [uncultured Gammaproteobacteria bacterium]